MLAFQGGRTESVVKNVTLYNAMPDGSGSGEDECHG